MLGQEAVYGNENEIVAIPRLLDMLDLTGMLVTIDAMGCQKAIAKTIRDKGADYLLPVKDNQLSLHNDIMAFFDEHRDRAFADCTALFHETTDQDHGRFEIRRHWSTGDIAWLAERHPWSGLASIAMIERDGKTETTRHYSFFPACRCRPILCDGFLEEGGEQGHTFDVLDAPADNHAAEDVHDKIEVDPFGRTFSSVTSQDQT